MFTLNLSSLRLSLSDEGITHVYHACLLDPCGYLIDKFKPCRASRSKQKLTHAEAIDTEQNFIFTEKVCSPGLSTKG